MSQRSVPAPFLMKTYQLVDDADSDDVISWNDDGTTFVVWKTAEFAKDLLPTYFKHNNFSSFVRQLNTYGFRKTVPDKWEFANDNFRRGEKELLTKIYRRKTVTATPTTGAGKSTAGCNATSSVANSGEDLGSSSTSSQDTKNPGSVETATTAAKFANLNDENERLRKDNQILSSELSHAKKQCEELVNFLSQHMQVAPDQINRIMSQEINLSRHVAVEDGGGDEVEDGTDDDDDDDKKGECLKLFGVMLKDKKRKRGHDDEINDISGPGAYEKDLKTIDFSAPWMKTSSSAGESSKVCN